MDIQQQLHDIANTLTNIAASLARPADPDSVAYASFTRLMKKKYPHNRTGHGAKRALLDYNQAEHDAGHTAIRITEAIEQSWLRAGVVPHWAFRYLQRIPVLPARPTRVRWSGNEIEYLARLIKRFPHETYDQLAARCSRRFRRSIGICAIKGMTDRHNFGKLHQSR